MLFLVRIFADFSKHAVSGFRMKECDVQALSSLSRLLVYKFNALTFEFGKASLYRWSGECNMMDTFASLFYELSNCSFRISAFQKLYLSLSDFEERSLYFLVLNLFNRVALQAKHFFIIRNSLFQRFYGNSKMFNMS